MHVNLPDFVLVQRCFEGVLERLHGLILPDVAGIEVKFAAWKSDSHHLYPPTPTAQSN